MLKFILFTVNLTLNVYEKFYGIFNVNIKNNKNITKYLPERVVVPPQTCSTFVWQTSSVLTTAQIAANKATTTKDFIFEFLCVFFFSKSKT